MNLLHGSVVDTAVEFIKQNFQVEMDSQTIADQMKTMTFKQQMDLVDAMKEDDISSFQSLITIEQTEVEESGGTISPTASVMQSTKSVDTKNNNFVRRATVGAIDASRDITAIPRTVAGGNKVATNNKDTDQAGGERDANKAAADEAQKLAQQNADRIKELTKKLVQGRG